jgi:hypothetical protein
MRGYCPVPAAGLATLLAERSLPGPRRVCVVDPAWRADAPEVDEEQWEYEAQQAAAAALDDPRGAVLAMDLALPGTPGIEDGWVEVPGPIAIDDVAAVLTADLAWYGVQELPALLAP